MATSTIHGLIQEGSILTFPGGYAHAGSRNNVYRCGNVAYISAVVIIDKDVPYDTVIATLPYESKYGVYAIAGTEAGADTHQVRCVILEGNNLKPALANDIFSGNILRLGISYICK